MKKKILASAALACLLAYAPQPARADLASDAIVKFADFVSRTPNAAMLACRKGNAASGTFSARSFEGALCGHPIVAAWALKTCPMAAPDFGPSKCAGIAVRTLNNLKMMDYSGMTAGAEDPDMALIQQVSKLTGSIKATLCRNPSNGGGALARACSAAPVGMPGMSAPRGGEPGMSGQYGDNRGTMTNPPMNNSGRYSNGNSGYGSGRDSSVPLSPGRSEDAYKTGSKNSYPNSGITSKQLKDGKRNLKSTNNENPNWQYNRAYEGR